MKDSPTKAYITDWNLKRRDGKQNLNITPPWIFGMLPRQVDAGIPASEGHLRSTGNPIILRPGAVITSRSFVGSPNFCHSWIFTEEDSDKRSYLFIYVEGLC
jgi:hypothetical protein